MLDLGGVSASETDNLLTDPTRPAFPLPTVQVLG